MAPNKGCEEQDIGKKGRKSRPRCPPNHVIGI